MITRGLYTMLFLLFSLNVCAQTDSVYVVTVGKLNVRTGPGTSYEIVYQLKRGDEIVVTSVENDNWYAIDLGFTSPVYVFSRMITRDPNWEKEYLFSGQTPLCYNIDPQYEERIDNSLNIIVGSHTDVVVKLMKQGTETDRCIRIAYIRSEESFMMKNIPEGQYYLKIAYGLDWRQKVEDGICYGRFMRRAHYEAGEEILDFRLTESGSGYYIPYYELQLDVLPTEFNRDNFRTNDISEEQFNR